MTGFKVKSAAVVGAGTMGGGIAALLAGVGLPVTLLDVAPTNLTAAEARAGRSLADRAVRNRIVDSGWERGLRARPLALFVPGDADQVSLGNLADDFDRLAEADWVIEAIVEDLDAKQALYGRLEPALKPGAIVSSNTSGLPLSRLAAGRSDEFRRRFLGTHFFNPPRYMHLLELIPTGDTDPALVDALRGFAERVLGKGVVVCKDTPNFIANRIGMATIGFRMWWGLEHGYSVEEIDLIAGPALGYPKTAVFRMLDLTGLDVSAQVERNLRAALPDEPTWNRGRSSEVIAQMLTRGWLGNKSEAGFYRAVRGPDGTRAFWVLNPDTLEHEPARQPRFESLALARAEADLGTRLRLILAHDDRAARFAWHDLAFQFAYCSQRISEIADDLTSIDWAMRWGYAHDLGPFEKWDALGVAETVARMEADGYFPAGWVKTMLAAGAPSFYRWSGSTRLQYNPQAQAYVPVVDEAHGVSLPALRRRGAEVERNDDASLHDLGDGVALLELHSKVNAFTPRVVELGRRALARLEDEFDALVIGNPGTLGSAEADLDPQLLAGGPEGLAAWGDGRAREFQGLIQAIRFASKPIVAAPAGRVVGGGAQICLAAHRIVAGAELAIGLVEAGAGLIPAGGGCKELLRRTVSPVMQNEHADPLPLLQRLLDLIGTARVSASAYDARGLGWLGPADRIVMNPDHLLAEAKREARHMADSGWRPVRPAKIYLAGRDVLAALRMQLYQMREGQFISEHDHLVAGQLAWVLCGGDLSAPAWVDEQYVLDLERKAFVFLIQQPQAPERIARKPGTGV